VISLDALNAWRATHPWADDEQIEQDLIMTRIAVEIASHPELSGRLAWRGGTCLHKLFLPAPLRYSEDLDYVAYRELSLGDDRLGRAAAHYLFHADVQPSQFRSRLAAHLEDPEFVTDVAMYLVDPTTAGDPRILVHRWTLWTDCHLDLPYAQHAADRTSSKRKDRAIHEITERLASGAERCPVHEFDGANRRRCSEPLNEASCAVHGVI
jgi:hypothetical protein